MTSGARHRSSGPTPAQPGLAPAPPEERHHPREHRRRWATGELPLRIQLPPAGLVLGTDVDGRTVAFPLLVPTHSTRVGIVGEVGLARLLALRLLDQSCDLTVVTQRGDEWQRLAAGVPETPFTISQQVRRWPLEGTHAPWSLIIDMDDPPPASFARAPWSTVLHLAPAAPHGSGWWQSAHLVLTTRAHARDIAAQRPRLDTAAIDRLTDEDVIAVDQTGMTVFRPALSQREYAVLTSV